MAPARGARALCAALLVAGGAGGAPVTISNVQPRRDARGDVMNAHDGTIRWIDGSWWMHAATYTEGADPPVHGASPGTDIMQNHNITIWRSPDLSPGSWEFLGNAIECTKVPGCKWLYRPHLVYNPATRLYVLFWNYVVTAPKMHPAGHENGMATSASPAGPFTYVGDLNTTYWSGDFDVFVDAKRDGRAYIIYASVHSMFIEALGPDFLTATGVSADIPGGHDGPWPFPNDGVDGGRGGRAASANLTAFPVEFVEAPAMFERAGRYYALFGHCCAFCYQGSGAFVFTAPHPLGPWAAQPGPADIGCVDGAADPTPAQSHTLPLTAEPTPGQGCQYSGHYPPSSAHPPRAAASTMRAQQNFVVEVETPRGPAYVWTGDRWMQAPDGVKAHEPQFWAELEFDAHGTIQPIKWVDSVTLNVTNQ